ncbi:NAD-dependent epimerase/dehydratase family protein [Curtobacterium sp. CFBP9011]|uniref:NAD-dependent epimerase/dehydratase family protein n=1 Tax=Curtobacterium sp. CFBP9011 TaxID=3096530 RepID=UPI002A6AFA8E|nr:NAD-dependent epimerase/dehydratase family protein [Curtobacterium sp. CFBP9011]MDY1004095.1 GDP-mannose 4,6-dehydratase [Curtobacterium sp. CFBP9011]
MKSIVTGGAGFIGSHLVERLLADGDDVVVLDDFSTGRADNLAAVAGHERLRVVEGSILDRELVAELVAGSDRVFHLAAAVGVKLIVDHPLQGLRTNIHGSENVLDACVAAGAKLLLVSTSEIYGKNTADALHETADRVLGSPLVARWTYAAAKGIDEAFAHAYFKEYGLRVAIVRPFNTVGPRQTGRYGMVVPNLVGQAVRGEPLTVYGDGVQSRCFSFVGDVVPAMVALIEHDAAYGEAFNLGGEREISIAELAELVIDIVDSDSQITYVPYDEAYGEGYEDMRRRVPDNTRAEAAVGFAPVTPLEAVVRLVAEDVRSRAVADAVTDAAPAGATAGAPASATAAV